ncbi:MAG: DNA-processing protein DprA [Oscillospiraceae bacterium]|nr:DNA-processing protein DprA [Oscillospiraceae bacterium]
MNYDLYWIWLSCGLGAGASCLDLISYYEWNPFEIYGAEFNELFSLNVMTKKRLERLKSFPLEKAEEILSVSRKNGWQIITPSKKEYPQRLLTLQDPPLVLYAYGDISVLTNELSVSVVGARKASDYGQAVARALSSAMASVGFTVVSGGALGIDSAAHLGALDENGKTVCVLGCGLGANYLMDNEPLRRRIAQNGAVITEFPPSTPASRLTFPLRNRIISGITLGTVVVEAGERSGSLITARLAAEQGRDVFAVPGDLVSSSFLGTNNLIRNGAKAVFSPNDILEEYCNRYFDRLNIDDRFPDDEIIKRAQKYLTQKKPEKTANPKVEKSTKKEDKLTVNTVKRETPQYLTKNAAEVYGVIGDEPLHVDEIISICGLSAESALSALTELEIYGLAVQLSGRRYKIGR